MRKLYLLLIFSTFPNCFSQTADTYSEPFTLENLKGKIKVLNERWYSVVYKFGEIQKERFLSEVTYKYNIRGNEIEKISNDYQYDMYVKYILKYNNSGKITEKNVYGLKQDLWKRSISKYDDFGNRIEVIRYNSDGSFDYKNTYKYENGNIISESFFDNENNYPTTSASYDYNDKKQKIKELDIIGIEYSYEYDDLGNMIKQMRGSEIVEINKYDDKNNIIESIDPENGTLHKFTYQYKYDKIGNWLKKIIFSNEKATYIIERKIEYYK